MRPKVIENPNQATVPHFLNCLLNNKESVLIWLIAIYNERRKEKVIEYHRINSREFAGVEGHKSPDWNHILNAK